MSVNFVRRETEVLFYMAGYVDKFCSLEGADAHTLKCQMLGAVDAFVTKCYSEAICTNRWTLLGYLICYFDSMGKLNSKGVPFPFLKYLLENESLWKAEIAKLEEKHSFAHRHCPIATKCKSPWTLYLDFPSRDVAVTVWSGLLTIINNHIDKRQKTVQESDTAISSADMPFLKTYSCLESAVAGYFEEMDK